MTFQERIYKLEREYNRLQRKFCCIENGGGGASMRFGFAGEDIQTAGEDRQFSALDGNTVFINGSTGDFTSSVQSSGDHASMASSDTVNGTSTLVRVEPTQLTINITNANLVFQGLATDDSAVQVLAIDVSGNTVLRTLAANPDHLVYTEANNFDSFIGVNHVNIPNGNPTDYAGVTGHVVYCDSCGYASTQVYAFFSLSNGYGPSPGHFIMGTHGVLSDQILIDFNIPTGALSVNSLVTSSVATSYLSTSAITATGLQVFANNAAALGGALVAGNFYRTAAGVVQVVF